MKVLLVPNYYKQEAVESGLTLELWLTRQGFEVEWAADQRSGIESTPDLVDCGLVISLGGDGTLLRAARIVGYREIPILGLSYGHLGFLTAASPQDKNILSVVSDALAGELHVSRRATLACEIMSVNERGEEGGLHRLCPERPRARPRPALRYGRVRHHRFRPSHRSPARGRRGGFHGHRLHGYACPPAAPS